MRFPQLISEIVRRQVLDLDVLDRILLLIRFAADSGILVPALRTLGNLFFGTSDQARAVLDSDALLALK